MTRIKIFHSGFLLFLIIVTLLASCKKEVKYTSTHAFWFDKATRDSLVKADNYNLAAVYNYTPQTGESGFISYTDTSSFFSSFPGCDTKHILFLKIILKKGEQKTISYKISKAEKSGSTITSNGIAVNNWQGEITIRAGECSVTQLKW